MTPEFKGIILAGGSGSRLHPITKAVSKHLLPIYDKPMIYYPISVLMLSNIKDILIISTPEDIDSYMKLLGDGNHFGLNLSYTIQDSPDGLAQAFILGEQFIGKSNVSLILGDNIFYGHHFSDSLLRASSRLKGATIFGYQVKDPTRFGVIEFDDSYNVLSIEEKPKFPKSNYAATGLYFYDNNVIEIAKSIEPSERGELEITDINKIYNNNKTLKAELLGRGFSWFDSGTHQSLMEAGQFVKSIEDVQGIKIACLEQIAFDKGWISKDKLIERGEELKKTNYGKFLLNTARL